MAGVRLLTASGDDLTDSDDLGRKMMCQVAGVFMEYEKGRLSPSSAPRGNASARSKITRRAVAGSSSPSEGRKLP